MIVVISNIAICSFIKQVFWHMSPMFVYCFKVACQYVRLLGRMQPVRLLFSTKMSPCSFIKQGFQCSFIKQVRVSNTANMAPLAALFWAVLPYSQKWLTGFQFNAYFRF